MENTIPNFLKIFDLLSQEKDDIISYLHLQRIRQMSEYFHDNPPDVWDCDKNKFAQANSFVDGHNAQIENNMYIKGAILKMFLDGKATIKPTEDKDANRKAVAIVRKARNTFGDRKEEDLNTEEENKLAEELIKERTKYAFRDREDIAVKRITSEQQLNDLTLLVFGNAHDFSNALNTYNGNNPQRRLGLIKLSVKEQIGK